MRVDGVGRVATVAQEFVSRRVIDESAIRIDDRRFERPDVPAPNTLEIERVKDTTIERIRRVVCGVPVSRPSQFAFKCLARCAPASATAAAPSSSISDIEKKACICP